MMSILTRFPLMLLLLVLGITGQLYAVELPTLVPLTELREGLAAPTRLAVDDVGNLYVADRRQQAVLQFNPAGEYQGQFDNVAVSGTGLAISDDGRLLFIAGKRSVNIVDVETGSAIGYLGSENEFGVVGSIAIDAEGRIFVADRGERAIKVYQLQSSEQGVGGELLYSFGQDRFASIFAMAVDRTNNKVYVADSIQTNNAQKRVEVFNLAGEWQQTLLFNDDFGSKKLGFVGEIGFDDAGRVYFVDKRNSNLRVLNADGQFLGSLLLSGHAAGKLWQPRGLAYQPGSLPGKGRLLIANGDRRIGVFGLEDPPAAASNTPPPIPTPLTPLNNDQVASNLPSLNFSEVVDADGDAVSYQLQVIKGDELIEELSVPAGAGPIATLNIPLTENASYDWRVQANDGSDLSGYSVAQNFFVNAISEPPSSPALQRPLDGDALSIDGAFSWSAASDPDPFSSVHYRIQVSADADFSQLQSEVSLAETSIPIDQLPNHAELVSGQEYWWRVLAEDEEGLVSTTPTRHSFVFECTELNLITNISGARVYLGGNHGYHGQYLGETPLSLRTLEGGPKTLVLTAPGFDPQVVQLDLPPNQVTDQFVRLTPALLAEREKLNPLKADKKVLQANGGGSPFAIDWDNDGDIDLLTGEGSGELTLYRNSSNSGMFLTSGQTLETPPIIGASPFVVDWNNDGRKDLLVGGSDGTLILLINNGSDAAPSFAEGRYLENISGVLDVGSSAAPFVTDWDQDGHKDLVVGSAEGQLLLYRNIGNDADVQLAESTTLLQLNEPVAPLVVDWDGDGSAELLLVHSGRVVAVGNNETGLLQPQENLFTLPNNWQIRPEKISAMRLFVLNINNEGAKDLLIGNAAGDLYLAEQIGDRPVPALQKLIEEKIARLRELSSVSSTDLVSLIDDIEKALQKNRLPKVGQLAEQLAADADEVMAVEAKELATWLQ